MLPVLLLSLTLLRPPGGASAAIQNPTPFDSTRHLIIQVGEAVADVKTGLELYRRAVFNSTASDITVTAFYLGRACRTLDLQARLAQRRVCRRCADAPLQRALEGYREAMPMLARMGTRCADRLERLSSGPDSSAARALKRNVRAISDLVIAGIVPYEQRLAVVRVRAGWARPQAGTPGQAPR